jgi:hypothetical protein
MYKLIYTGKPLMGLSKQAADGQLQEPLDLLVSIAISFNHSIM